MRRSHSKGVLAEGVRALVVCVPHLPKSVGWIGRQMYIQVSRHITVWQGAVYGFMDRMFDHLKRCNEGPSYLLARSRTSEPMEVLSRLLPDARGAPLPDTRGASLPAVIVFFIFLSGEGLWDYR